MIRKCAVQDKFEKHLRNLETNQINSAKFEHIDERKEVLKEAIHQVQNNSNELLKVHEIVANTLQDIRVDILRKDNDIAIARIDKVLDFYKQKLQINKEN